MKIFVKLILLCLFLDVLQAQEEILNRCLNSNYHKESPSPENDLSGTCEPWKERSCCTSDIANKSNDEGFENLYNFTYDHCPNEKNMSVECRKAFQRNNCFYECSPNLGPWLTTADNTDRQERFENVPICGNQCEAWWEACKDDYTCLKDWRTGWNWTTGTNQCPENETCKTFSEIFGSSKKLCNIYPGDYEVVDENEGCMVFNFISEDSNPNDEVARDYATEKGLCCGTKNIVASQLLQVLFLTLGVVYNYILK